MKNNGGNSNMVHIKDEVSVLSSIELMKQKQKEILKILSENTVINRVSSELLRITEEIDNLAIDIKNSKDSINYYYYNTPYDSKSLEEYKTSTNKNAYIYDIKLNKNVSVNNLIQPISITIRNLGFEGVVAEDIVKLKFYNNSLNEDFRFETEINTNIKALREEKEIVLNEVPFPTTPYEYTLSIEILSNGEVFGKATVRGINVIGGTV